MKNCRAAEVNITLERVRFVAMKTRRIVIGSDHAGYELKEHLKGCLQNQGYSIEDVGTYSIEAADYPEFAHKAMARIEKGDAEAGIIMCGTGNGINMAANKHQQIRAALCWNVEIAVFARQHNNANVCSLPARYISKREAEVITEAFLTEEFEGGRHQRRVEKIPC